MAKRWVKISAKEQKLGRLATQVAGLLIGKDLPSFQANQGALTHVVVVDCRDIVVTSRRLTENVYHHTGYIGNLKKTTRAEMSPIEVVRKAIAGMLPRNKTRRSLLQHLHCQHEHDHPYKQYLNE